MVTPQAEPNWGRPSARPPHSGMSLKPWAPHGTLIGSNAMNAGRYHAGSGPSRLSWRSIAAVIPEGSDFASCPAPLQHLELIKNEGQPNFNFWQNEPKSCGTRATPMFGT